MKKRFVFAIIIAIVTVVVVFFVFKNNEMELQMNTAAVDAGTVENRITATGYVQPVDQVEVGTQVSGVIERIYVDFNSRVTKGQLLAELDKLTLKEKVLQGEASVVSSQSDLTYAHQNFDRVKQLYEAKAATQTAYEEAVNRLAQANTSVVNAQANLHQAKVNLSYAEIYSPIDGVVLDRTVEQGQTVAASFSTPTLFTIANDLKNMQVEADVDEADIGQVKAGQAVAFTVDAYPDETFAGTVNQVRLKPTVTSNVVTYTVIIDAPNANEKLFPGMTASVTIVTRSEEGILVPMEALAFVPDAEVAVSFNAVADAKRQGGGVWIKKGNSIEYAAVQTGLSDGAFAAATAGLSVGDTVVLSASFRKNENRSDRAAGNPLMPRPPARR